MSEEPDPHASKERRLDSTRFRFRAHSHKPHPLLPSNMPHVNSNADASNDDGSKSPKDPPAPKLPSAATTSRPPGMARDLNAPHDPTDVYAFFGRPFKIHGQDKAVGDKQMSLGLSGVLFPTRRRLPGWIATTTLALFTQLVGPRRGVPSL